MITTGPPTNVIQLRKLLGEKLPQLAQREIGRKRGFQQTHPTGIAALDRGLNGGLVASQMTELVGVSHGTGLVLRAMVRTFHAQNKWVALVDGHDCFDVASLGIERFPRLLWLRCGNPMQAVKTADLVLRDNNVPVVLMDLFLHPASELMRIPTSTWFRFQRIVEQSASALLVVTPTRLVTPARKVLALNGTFTLDGMKQSEAELLGQLRVRLIRERVQESPNPLELLAHAG